MKFINHDDLLSRAIQVNITLNINNTTINNLPTGNSDKDINP